MAMGDTYNLNPATPRVLPWCGFDFFQIVKEQTALALKSMSDE